MSFKLGDVVTIADLRNMKVEPHFGLNSDMKKFSGMQATIMKIHPEYYICKEPNEDGCLYRIDLDNATWSWSNLMFTNNNPFKVTDEDFE